MGWCDIIDDSIRPSVVYPRCYFCPRCSATYTPGLSWGFCYREKGNTSGEASWSNVKKLDNECPYCNRQPVELIEG